MTVETTLNDKINDLKTLSASRQSSDAQDLDELSTICVQAQTLQDQIDSLKVSHTELYKRIVARGLLKPRELTALTWPSGKPSRPKRVEKKPVSEKNSEEAPFTPPPTAPLTHSETPPGNAASF